jgi:hypothetical protein
VLSTFKLLFKEKIRNDIFFLYLSYGLFIGFSIFTQIVAVKIFSSDVSKLYIFFIAVFSYGSFIGEAGFSRYDISTKEYKQSLLYSIYIKKFLSFVVLNILGLLFLENIYTDIDVYGFLSLTILFFFSSFFLPSNIFKKGFKKIAYLPNTVFIISLFFSFTYSDFENKDINKVLLLVSILSCSCFYFLYKVINPKVIINIKDIRIIRFENTRVKMLNLTSYLGAGISFCLILLIANFYDKSSYLLLTRLYDGLNSFLGLLTLVCIKHKMLSNWINVLSLTIISVIFSFILLIFILNFDNSIDFLNSTLPIFIYFTIQISGTFISGSLSQHKKEKNFDILIKLNVISLTLGLILLFMAKIDLINIWQFNIYLYFLSFLTLIPVIIFSKISYALSNNK